MISQIASIKSSFPSAFAALGVGSVASLGDLILIRRWPPGQFSVAQLPPMPEGSSISAVLPYLFGFVAFFFVYAVGFACIGFGSRMRTAYVRANAHRVSRCFKSGNDAFIKYYFEQQAVIDVFDGLAAAFPFLFLSAAIASFSTANIALALGSLLAGAASVWAFSREARRRAMDLDYTLDSVVQIATPKP